ncbi:uncharacterized protein BJ171DRAFT_251073 [Polychytrium aggregatum]|uniref:uncharacterized protein n=1 Tax=Polychytrium aggregatum TaxID=110093 RepID=UPI0022FF3445|nr:uncharacterized protein BJ171DRAFT_251073 [Polychytrium aggregatum]KAI9193549.1 hypothetical protein BJ171DRAFT_251073 [Polychytrium aggregatum]
MGNSLICSRPPMQTLSSPPQAEHTAIQNPVQLPTPLPSMSSSSHKPDAVSSQSAFTSLHSEALSGNCTAQFRLGLLYDLGTLSDQPELTVGSDPAHANYWYLLAAKQNHIGAQYNLALNYQNGAGCSKNLVKASKWFLKAAKLGCVDAQVNIANYYRRGWGRCCQDNVASMAWFLLAAQNGDATAQFILAQAYQHGKGGLAIDLIEAHNWCQRAADQGHQPASLYLERLDQDPNGEATDAAHDQHEPEDDCESSSDSEIASAVKAYEFVSCRIHRADDPAPG